MKARIAKGAPSWQVWMNVFGTDTIPIIEPPKENAEGRLRMLVDVGRLEPMARSRLAVELAQAWKRPSDEVLRSITATGSTSISAEDVSCFSESEAMGGLFDGEAVRST